MKKRLLRLKSKLLLPMLFLLLMAISMVGMAQTPVTIWSEDFDDDAINATTGTGSPNLPGVGWTAVGGLKVKNQRLEGTNVESQCYWNTTGIPILGYTEVTISITIGEIGLLENQDQVKVSYTIDTNNPVNFAHLKDDFDLITLTQTDIFGDALFLDVDISNNAIDETHYIDDVIITGVKIEPTCVTPIIASAPASITNACLNSPASFDVTIENATDETTYQWYYRETVSGTPAPITGANADSYSINNLTLADAGLYSVQISNGTGCEITSSEASLTFDNEAPTLQTGSSIPAGESEINACIAPVGPTEVEIAALYEDNSGGIITVTKSGTPTGDKCGWSVTYSYEVKDACGNIVTPAPTVTYSGADKSVPTATAPATVDLECADDLPAAATTIAGFLALDDVADAGDNCTAQADLTVTSSDAVTTAGSCAGVITRTYKISDACENFVEVDQVFTVTDNTNPTATAPATVDLECADDLPAAATTIAGFLALDDVADAGDNCTAQADLTVTSSDAVTTAGSCAGVITRTYKISDACENFVEVDQVFTVTDNTNPTAVCKNITINLDATGHATIAENAVNNGSSDNCTAADNLIFDTDVTSFDCSNVGTINVILTVTDVCGNSSTCNATVTVNVPTTTVAKLSAPSARYADDITLYAEIEANCPTNDFAGDVEFFIGGVSVGSAPAYPIPQGEDGYPNKLRATLIHKITEMPKTDYTNYNWPVKAEFTASTANYNDSEGANTLKIYPRSATYLGTGFYTGDEFVWTPTINSSTGTVVLAATIKDANSPTGDVRGALVTFYYDNGAGNYTPIPSATNLPVGLVDMTDGTIGTASADVQLNIGNQNSASFKIAVGISGAYINRKSDPTAIAVVTVSKPVPGGYVVVGGSLLNSKSSGLIKGANGIETGFSIEVKFNNKMTNPQGKAYVNFSSYYKPDGTLDNVTHNYEITSNAISVFQVGKPDAKQASFSSKANLVEVFDNAPSIGIESGTILQLTMWDNGIGTSDKFGITLQRKSGGVWFSSSWDVTKTVDQLLNGGNVYVSTAGSSQASATVLVNKAAFITPEVPFVEPTLRAYPNPFTERLNIEFSNATDTQGTLEIYSVTGARLATLFNGPVEGGVLYKVEYVPNLVSSQMVLYKLTMDGKTQVGKMMYNERR